MEQKQIKHLVFTYGTLKKGFYNDYHLKNSVYLGEGYLPKQKDQEYYQIVIDNHWFVPYLYPIEKLQKQYKDLNIDNAQEIKGEIYGVTDDQLVILDKLESVPIRYRRDLKQVVLIKNTDFQIHENILKQFIKDENQLLQDQIFIDANIYICNLDLDDKFGGHAGLISDYTLKDHEKYVIPSKREQKQL